MKSGNKSKKNKHIIKKIGQNYLVNQCPVLIPEENIEWFSSLIDTAEKSHSNFKGYSNVIEKLSDIVKSSINEVFVQHTLH